MSMTGPTSGLPAPNLTTTLSTIATIPTDQNGYIQLPVTVDPLQLISDAFAFIQQQVGGWIPREGHLEVWVIEACARMVTVCSTVASLVPIQIFEYLGGQLLGVPPNLGAQAEAPTTWTMVDNKGYTVPSGTVVGFQTSGNTLILFTTTAAFTVPPGSTSTTAGQVIVTAQSVGASGNGIAGGALTLVDSLAYVASVTSTAVTSGGADAETTGTYLNRLSQRFQLLTPRPVLGRDFAIMAAQVAGVYRAAGIDNYNPYANGLTVVDASFETGVGTWTAGTNSTVATSTGFAVDGTHSLAITATAAATATRHTGMYPVSPGLTYSGAFQSHAVATARAITATLTWFDINATLLSTSSGTPTNDSTAGGVAITVTAAAPSTAAYVELGISIAAPAASEVHDIDVGAIYLGTLPASWSAGGSQTQQERYVTVVPVDIDGNALTTPEMAAVATFLQSLRETNFVVAVIPPTYTAVNVVAQVVAQSSADLNAVQTAVTNALSAYLSPGTWAGGGQDPPVWLADTTVYYLDVAGVIMNVPGVHHVVAGSLTLNGGTTDVNLAGLVALPQPTINVNVTAAPVGS